MLHRMIRITWQSRIPPCGHISQFILLLGILLFHMATSAFVPATAGAVAPPIAAFDQSRIASYLIPAEFPECTGGRVKRGNRCVCLSGWAWTGARCVRENCPPGMIGSPPNCQRAANCTGGRTLRGGACVCPLGLSWTGSRCVRPSCPPGQRGIPPNCRPITLNCPPGKIGRPPNCR